MMTKVPTLPPIGKQRVKWLAVRFGSTTGRVADIANPGDRRRCEARIEFESSYGRLWEAETRRGCPTVADYEACIRQAAVGLDADEHFHWRELKRPARLRGNMSNLLNPFAVSWPMDSFCTEPGLDTPRALIVNVPDARRRYTAIVWGAENETAKGVTAECRAQYDEAMQAEAEGVEVMREAVARHYGSASGDVSDIPQANRATASRYWRRCMALYDMRCEFELALTRISTNERKAEEQVRAVAETREIEEQATHDTADALGFG